MPKTVRQPIARPGTQGNAKHGLGAGPRWWGGTCCVICPGPTQVTCHGIHGRAAWPTQAHSLLQVSDAGLAAIQGLERLQCLGLVGAAVSEAGMRAVGQLTNLLQLDVGEIALQTAGVPASVPD